MKYVLLTASVLLVSCTVGPKYKKPSAPTTPAFKEPPPDGWKEAQPNDAVLKGKWWELYNDPVLNALEEQVAVSNQNVLAAEAQFREAKDLVRVARANLFPIVTTSPAISSSGSGGGGGTVQTQAASGSTVTTSSGSSVRNSFNLPVDFSYQADIWGNIRRGVHQQADLAQASSADLENVKLMFEAELATDYFQMHGVDGQMELLERTVKSYEDYLKLTQDRFKSGVASGGDVAQAETQLESARAGLIDLEQSRQQFEHAIAVLTGKPPAEVTIPRLLLKNPPPVVPVGLPSTLLERRPDIAAAERQMAAANEQIGINQAAFYPQLTITAAGGLQSGSFVNWFSWPARFWSVGAGLAQTLFDAGKRRAQLAQAKDAFDVTIANYRQTVLTAFQQVEDNLASLRVLQNEARAEDAAADAAERSLTIATAQYKAGTVSYLQVITSQAAALSAENIVLQLRTRRMVSSVQLIEALGGGWDASQLPTEKDVSAKK